MWIINLLPDWIFYSVLLLGVLGLIATYLLKLLPIPLLYTYRIPIQIISIVFIVFGTYMSGAIYNEGVWKAKVQELEKQVAEAKVQSEKINTETTVKYVTKREIIRQQGEERIKYIDREIIKYNDNCKLPKEVVTLHNEAAKGEK